MSSPRIFMAVLVVLLKDITESHSQPFTYPVDAAECGIQYTHWAPCPLNGEPILMRFVEAPEMSAMEELVVACEAEFAGPEMDEFPDDEDIATPPSGITFGMIRRARAELSIPVRRFGDGN